MIWQMIEDWFRGILTDGILSNLSGLFDSVNTEVGEIATQVGTTPAGWNAGIFNMIRSLSENVIVPIAGVIITFVMCYELIQLVIEKNNLHDLDTWIFFKWIFKTFVAVLLVTNTWNIVMGVFDVTQIVVNDSAGVILSDTSIDIATVITDIEAKLDAMSVGGLLGLWFQSLFVGLTMKALSICIMLVVYGRMIEIYLVSRGCPRNCGFCIVSGKEGRKSVKVADLSEFWKWQPEIKIMDANLLACPDHENLIEQLMQSRAWVDFSQGLDIRLVSRDNVSLLNRVRIKAVHFAWDNPDEDLTGYFQRFLDLTAIKSSRQRRVYVLTNYGSTHEQDLYRVNTLRAMGFDPYVMIYERPTAPPVTRHLQRWVNNKRLFYAVPRFEDYIPGRKEV